MKSLKLSLSTILLVHVVIYSKVSGLDYASLRKHLLEDQKYDKNLRPINDDNETTLVRMAFHPHHILEMNEITETLMTEGIVEIQWNDEKLKWDSKLYNNISEIHLGDYEIWQPDIHLFYSAGSNSLDQGRDTNVIVRSDGLVSWYPPATFEVPCLTDYKYFPYDKHNCTFEFGSWTHGGDSIFLNIFETFRLNAKDITGAEWKLESYEYRTHEYYQGLNYPYNAVKLTLIVKRVSSLYKLTTVVPIISSAFMTLAGFWLELWTTPRYILGIANYAMVAIHLLSLATSLPAGGDIPLLAQFSATSVCLAVAFLVVTVGLDSTQRRLSGPPEFLIRFARIVPEQILCAIHVQVPVKNSTTGETEPESDTNSKAKSDWNLVCVVLDRLFFYIFSFIYVLVTALLLSI